MRIFYWDRWDDGDNCYQPLVVLANNEAEAVDLLFERYDGEMGREEFGDHLGAARGAKWTTDPTVITPNTFC